MRRTIAVFAAAIRAIPSEVTQLGSTLRKSRAQTVAKDRGELLKEAGSDRPKCSNMPAILASMANAL
jgi:hypothetical protein